MYFLLDVDWTVCGPGFVYIAKHCYGRSIAAPLPDFINESEDFHITVLVNIGIKYPTKRNGDGIGVSNRKHTTYKILH